MSRHSGAETLLKKSHQGPNMTTLGQTFWCGWWNVLP